MDNLLPDPQPGTILLLIAPAHISAPILLGVITRLALKGPVDGIDGGNRFNTYQIARQARRQSPDLHTILRRIRVARAFTCYQIAALLARAPAAATPIVVFDLLSMFYDENVPVYESARLLAQAIAHLRRLGEHAPLAVSASPPPAGQAERTGLIAQLQGGLEGHIHVVTAESPPAPTQPRLF